MGLNSKPMTELSTKVDESSLDCKKHPEKVDSISSSEGSFLNAEPDKLRFWFNELLGLFLKESCAQGCLCSLPPMADDGEPVDWLKLFMVVKQKGGYNAVSESGLWDSVAVESGLALNVAWLVKLVFVKYLGSLERWLERVVQSDDWKSETNYGGHLLEMGAELKRVLSESKKVVDFSQVAESVVAGSGGGEKCVTVEESMHIDIPAEFSDYEEIEILRADDDLKSVADDSDGRKKSINVDEYVDTPSDLGRSVGNSSDVEKMCNANEVKRAIMEDSVESKKSIDSGDDNDDVLLDSNDIKEKSPSHKRKRDSMWGTLNWVIEVAKDPCYSVVGSLPESSKWKSYGSDELWKQILLFREATIRRKDDHSSSDQSKWQNSQKMHPSMYVDDTKLRYDLRERLSCAKKLHFGNTESKRLDSSMTGTDKQLDGTCDPVTPGSVFDYDNDIQVPIGPQFQAEVPVWTGVASESDAKWAGTRVWPLEKKENTFLIERDRMGKGRQDSCGCHTQGSIQCVRFHVAERRSKVKLELGSAFSKWKFDKMGEDVASAWTEKEQKKFLSIVNSNPSSQEKCFWDEICKRFRNKSREELVSYHYNVFLLQRRANQNRATPSNIYSDDEEPEPSVAKGSGKEASKPYTSILNTPTKDHKKSRYASSSNKYGIH